MLKDISIYFTDFMTTLNAYLIKIVSKLFHAYNQDSLAR